MNRRTGLLSVWFCLEMVNDVDMQCRNKDNTAYVSSTLRETHLSLTNRATHLCKCNDMGDLLKYATPHMFYHANFGRFRSNRVRISSGGPAKLRSARMAGMTDCVKTSPSPICVTVPNLVVLC